MALHIGAEFDLELAFSRLEKKLDEQNAKLRNYLTRPHAEIRSLFAAQTGTTAPIVLDLGAPAGGLLWSVQQVNVSVKDPFTSGAAVAGTAATVANVAASSGVVAAAVATGTLPAVSGQTNAVSGFQITGLGATGATVVVATLTGVLGGTQSYEVTVPAGVTTAISPVIVNFNPPLPATGTNVAISISVPSFGAGNTNAEANIQGTLTTAGAAAISATNAAIFLGGIPSVLTSTSPTDMASVVAAGLTPPANYQAGGKSIIARQGQHLYVLLTGNVSAGSFFASGTVLEIPDTNEALTWL